VWTCSPALSVKSAAQEYRLKVDSIDAQALTNRLTGLFDVSRDAARVRLLKLGHLAG
jgi:hypothetical protein